MPGTLWAQTLCYASYKEFYMSLCQAFAAGSTDKGCLPKVDTGFGTKDTRKKTMTGPDKGTGHGA